MRQPTAALAALAVLATVQPAPSRARDPEPVTDDSVDAEDVAKTPLTDLNISKEEIPELLVKARADPYDTAGLSGCRQIIAAVEELDAVLGEDLDTAEAQRRGVNAGRVAQWAVGTFIPFRGLLREVSGAKAHDRKMRDAIIGGMMRRAYLKGIGKQKGCRYPGRPARVDEVEKIKARMEAEADAADRADKARKAEEKRAERERRRAEKEARKAQKEMASDARNVDAPGFVSQPVVQGTN